MIEADHSSEVQRKSPPERSWGTGTRFTAEHPGSQWWVQEFFPGVESPQLGLTTSGGKWWISSSHLIQEN